MQGRLGARKAGQAGSQTNSQNSNMFQLRTPLQCLIRNWDPGRNYNVCIFNSLNDDICVRWCRAVFCIGVVETGGEGRGRSMYSV